MATFHFNANEVEPDSGFGVIPAGTYIAQVVDSDVRENRNKNGSYMALQFEILDGEFKGRRVFTNLTVTHKNKTAEQIGQAQLSALCRAVGVMQLTETSQLHNRPLNIKVKITKSEQYGESNDINGFEAINGGAAPAPAPASAPATTKPANTPPWER